MYEGIIQELIDELGRLPGIGPKSAQRIAFHVIQSESVDVNRLVEVLRLVKERVKFCSQCFNIAEEELCKICRDVRRDDSLICVVEESKDEIIIATDPNLEGEATATYLARTMKPLGIKISRLASGLPVGGDLEYADEVTLGRAFEGRRSLDL